MKSITLILSSLLLSACTIISSPGKEFYTDIWSSSRDPVYVLNGTYQGYNLYVVTPKYATNIDEAGVLVDSKKIIYKSLTSQDLLNIMSERRKIVQDKVDKQVAVDKIASQLNLSLIYQSNDFYIYQDNKKQYAFFKDGKQVNKIDVTSEIQAYNDKIKADKAAKEGTVRISSGP